MCLKIHRSSPQGCGRATEATSVPHNKITPYLVHDILGDRGDAHLKAARVNIIATAQENAVIFVSSKGQEKHEVVVRGLRHVAVHTRICAAILSVLCTVP